MNMKRSLLLLTAIFMTGCSLNKGYYYDTLVLSLFGTGNGYTNIKVEADVPLISPFDTSISIWMYNDVKQFEDYSEEFNANFQNLHAYFDSNYLYTIDSEYINNLKVINNKYGTGEFIKVPDELYDILKVSVDLTKISKGKFNVAVGSLSSLWDRYIEIGQYRENLIYVAPTQEEITSALSAVPSYEKIDEIIEFNDEEKTVRINTLEGAKENVRLTLGAIGKGYAVKKMEEILDNKVKGYISGGESSIAMLSSAPNKTWSLSLRNPVHMIKSNKEGILNTGYNPSELLFSRNGVYSFSTSGNYNNFYTDENNNLYHHIIDPITGYPSTHFATVAAVCNDSTYADAITTALMTMTLEEGKTFIKQLKELYGLEIEPIWMIQNNDKVEVKAASSLKNELKLDKGNYLNKYITTIEFIEINDN